MGFALGLVLSSFFIGMTPLFAQGDVDEHPAAKELERQEILERERASKERGGTVVESAPLKPGESAPSTAGGEEKAVQREIKKESAPVVEEAKKAGGKKGAEAKRVGGEEEFSEPADEAEKEAERLASEPPPYSARQESEEEERMERESAEGRTIVDKLAPVEKKRETVERGEKALPIVADADSVEFDREQNVVTGTGNAVVKYRGAKLTADKITVYLDTGDAYAEGNVSLFQEGQFLTGKNLRYNFENGEGNITDCHAYVQPWYGYGKTVRRISANEYQVENGYVTTCDYPKPHTSLRAKNIYIYPGDSVVAHNVVMNLYETPVFWAPYAKYSLVDDESPYNFVPGYNSDWGFFMLSAFDVYKTKNVRLTPHVDYRTKRGVGIGVTMDHRLPSARANGQTVFYYAHDNDPDYTLNSDLDLKDRYRVTFTHQQDFSEDTRMTIDFNKQSDEDFINDFFRGEYEDDIQRENYIDITKATEKYQLSLRAEPRFNKFYTVVQRLPEFSIDAVNQRIGQTPFFYQSRSAITNFDYRFSDDPLNADQVDEGMPDPPIPDPIKSLRVDTYHEISYPKKYFKFLNFKPWAGLRETFYSKAPSDDPGYKGSGVLWDTDGDGVLDQELVQEVRSEENKNVWRGLFTLGAQADTKFWRVWDYYNSTLKINKLRHVFEPTLTYKYFSRPTRSYPHKVYQFDEYDFFNETSMFTLELRNALQTKRGEGEDVDIFNIKMYIDMLTNRSSYDGQYHRAFADDHYSSAEVQDGFEKLFNDIFIDAEFRPIDWQKLDFETYVNPIKGRLDEFNTDFYVYRNDVASVALGQRYLVDASNLWTTEFNLQLNDDWAARTYLRFEAFDGTFEQGEWSLFRDLHEWEAAFTVMYKGRRKSSVGLFVLLYLDAYPDIPLEVRF
jgi:lipopolysaccharide assembly outer membrane protein LptD (OstA)